MGEWRYNSTFSTSVLDGGTLQVDNLITKKSVAILEPSRRILTTE